MTECTSQAPLFSIGRRVVTPVFDGHRITSNAGVILLKRVDDLWGLSERFAGLLRDDRDPSRVRHTHEDLIRQRTYQICCGYEDCNDADSLREDPGLQLALERIPGDANAELASQPTLSRLEAGPGPRELFRISELFVDLFIEWLAARGQTSERIILDFDPTDDPTHGQQELSFFHGYYGQHMLFPLLVFSQHGFPIAAVLRPGNVAAYKGTIAILSRAVAKLRRRFPKAPILFRADAGFGVPEIYEFCEASGLEYLIGQNSYPAWKQRVSPLLEQARGISQGPQRLFADFSHRAKGWSRMRRIIVKAEIVNGEENPRFLVTNLSGSSETLYRLYILRGEAENHIKALKNAMFGDRLSCHRFLANQFRLLLHTAAYILMFLLREHLQRISDRAIQLDTLRLLLIRVGANIKVTARRVWVQLSASQPKQDVWMRLALTLATGPPR
jgi:hypothetical protein